MGMGGGQEGRFVQSEGVLGGRVACALLRPGAHILGAPAAWWKDPKGYSCSLASPHGLKYASPNTVRRRMAAARGTGVEGSVNREPDVVPTVSCVLLLPVVLPVLPVTPPRTESSRLKPSRVSVQVPSTAV